MALLQKTCLVLAFLPYIMAKFPCMNDGLPILMENTNFKCDCKSGFSGPFCEYDDEENRRPTESVEKRVSNVIMCIFFLLILPTLIIYLIRTIYLFLKRCHTLQRRRLSATNNGTTAGPREVTVTLMAATPNSTNGNTTTTSRSSRRPLHGSHSLTIHNTASLSLHEFNELLNSIQSLQQIQRNAQAANAPLPPPYESVARTTSYRSLR